MLPELQRFTSFLLLRHALATGGVGPSLAGRTRPPQDLGGCTLKPSLVHDLLVGSHLLWVFCEVGRAVCCPHAESVSF